jgi:hypothetical protein
VSVLSQGDHTVSMASGEQSSKNYIREYVGPCPYCGFHLQQLKTNKCSECGNTLEISLKAPFRLSGWLLMLVGLCSSIVSFSSNVGIQFWGGYTSGHVAWKIIIPELMILLILVFITYVWLFMYQWFSARMPATRWVAGITGCLLPFILYQVMAWVIIL